jgi:hypothetical protein
MILEKLGVSHIAAQRIDRAMLDAPRGDSFGSR